MCGWDGGTGQPGESILPQEMSGNHTGGNSWRACRGRCGAGLTNWVERVNGIFQACFSIGFLQHCPLPLPNPQNRNREVNSLIPFYLRMRLSFEEGSFHQKTPNVYKNLLLYLLGFLTSFAFVYAIQNWL